MRRCTILLAALLLTGCAMWQALPADATPAERAAYEAAVASDEAKVRAGGETLGMVLPPPFNWLAPVITAVVLGTAGVVRSRKR